MLGEKVINRHYMASTLMILGSMLALTFTSKTSDTLDIHDIKSRILSRLSICTLIINFALMAVAYIFALRIIYDILRVSEFFDEQEAKTTLLKNDNRETFDSSSTQVSEMDLEKQRISNLSTAKRECLVHDPKWLKFCIYAFPWFAGFMSGMLALVAKCAMMLIFNLGDSENSSSPFTYIIFVAVPIFVVSELFTLNLGLKYFDS